ncbi:unnamed protein product, partial [Polarella glacialis]
ALKEFITEVDTNLCFDESPAVLLTHVEIFLGRTAPKSSFVALEAFEAPKYVGDELLHPLERSLLPVNRPWPYEGKGKHVLSRLLPLPRRRGRQVLQLRPPVLLIGRLICLGFTFPKSAIHVSTEFSWDLTNGTGPLWKPLLWTNPHYLYSREPCAPVGFNGYHTARKTSWAVGYKQVTQALEPGSAEIAIRCPWADSDLHQSPAQIGAPPARPKTALSVSAWPVVATGRQSDWRETCLSAALHDDTFASFRRPTGSKAAVGIISIPASSRQTAECLLREILAEEARSAHPGIGWQLWQSMPEGDAPMASVGRPLHHLLGGRSVPSDLIMHTLVLKWIVSRFGNLRGMNILEIGGGFGGLASLVLGTFAVRSYTIVDLPEVQMLQQRYLTSIGPAKRFAGKVAFVDAGFLSNATSLLERYDLLISACAFSELSTDLQKTYYDKLFRYSERGLIVDNRYTLVNSEKPDLGMNYSGFRLLDRLINDGFYCDLKTWQAVMPCEPSWTPLNSVIFWEKRNWGPGYVRSDFWDALH